MAYLATTVCALLALLTAACSSAPPAAPASGTAALAGRIKDFRMVPYQGEDLLGGREVEFSSVFANGKPVVLNFWAGQCPPCRAEMPEFQRVADEFEGRVIFVGLDVGIFTGLGNPEDARRLLQELGIRYPTAYAVDASSLQLYSVRSMPTTVYLSATGEVIRTSPGIVTERQLRDAVRSLVGS